MSVKDLKPQLNGTETVIYKLTLLMLYHVTARDSECLIMLILHPIPAQIFVQFITLCTESTEPF